MKNANVLLLTYALALSGCAANGKVVAPSCPRLADPPPEVMETPDFEKRVREILFESDENTTPSSPPAKPSSGPTARP